MSSTFTLPESLKALQFFKMHGLGNDYVYMVSDKEPSQGYSDLARAVAERHCGIGGDGLVIVSHSDVADVRMRMWNADGSEAAMCGNASRCVALLARTIGLTDKDTFTLETKAGIKVLTLHGYHDGTVENVTVDMGRPLLTPAEVPVRSDILVTGNKPELMQFEVDVQGEKFDICAVGMGNPHGVIFIDHSPTDHEVLCMGKELEVHDAWPEKANIEFAHVLSPTLIEMRVWERGTGETMACGTGACATAVAAMLRGLTERSVTIRLRGGDLKIEWRTSDDSLLMSGPATLVASGSFYIHSILANPFLQQ